MDEKRPHLVVEGSTGDFNEFREVYPEFCAKISDFEKFENDHWGFVVVFRERFDITDQEGDLMDFLVEHYIELGYLRENHGVQMSAALYISPAHPGGMLSFDPEVIGLCAGLGIELQVHPLE